MSQLVSYQPTNLSELEIFCERICKTNRVPEGYKGKPDEAIVAIMQGNEWGLPPLASLQAICVINGMPRVYGDYMAGIAKAKGLIRGMREWFEGEPFKDDFTACCHVERPDGSVVEQRFSVADAKLAKLWQKVGPWTQYPKRMLQFRARSWAVRDAAPDMYFGMSHEEARDIDIAAQRRPERARDITPERPSPSPKAAVDATLAASQAPPDYDDDGVIYEEQPDLIPDLPEQSDPDPLHIKGMKTSAAVNTVFFAIDKADRLEADKLLQTYRAQLEARAPEQLAQLSSLVEEKIIAGAALI